MPAADRPSPVPNRRSSSKSRSSGCSNWRYLGTLFPTRGWGDSGAAALVIGFVIRRPNDPTAHGPRPRDRAQPPAGPAAQGLVATHIPSVQTLPLAHSSLTQHGKPGIPQVRQTLPPGKSAQTPSVHVSPVQQGVKLVPQATHTMTSGASSRQTPSEQGAAGAAACPRCRSACIWGGRRKDTTSRQPQLLSLQVPVAHASFGQMLIQIPTRRTRAVVQILRAPRCRNTAHPMCQTGHMCWRYCIRRRLRTMGSSRNRAGPLGHTPGPRSSRRCTR